MKSEHTQMEIIIALYEICQNNIYKIHATSSFLGIEAVTA